MPKVAISRDYGGFRLSLEAIRKLIDWGVPVIPPNNYSSTNEVVIFDTWQDPGRYQQDGNVLKEEHRFYPQYELYWVHRYENRTNLLLIRVIEELGSIRASAEGSSLHVVEIPDDIEWHIVEEDNFEYVAEKHRTWGREIPPNKADTFDEEN